MIIERIKLFKLERAKSRELATRGTIRHIHSVRQLVSMLDDKDLNGDVVHGVTTVLQEIGASAVQPLIDLLRSKGIKVHVKVNVERALIYIGSAAIQPLIGALDNKDMLIRASAKQQLDNIYKDNSIAVCDICCRRIKDDDNKVFLLTTRQVVTSEDYWVMYFRNIVNEYSSKSSDLVRLMPIMVGRMASMDTPWMVCEECSRMFSFNRDKGKDMAYSYRSTGKPAGGFRLCRVVQQGMDTIIKNIDDDGMLAALSAARRALIRLGIAKKPKLHKWDL